MAGTMLAPLRDPCWTDGAVKAKAAIAKVEATAETIS